MPLSIATTDDALAVFANPAGLGMNRGWQFYYLYNFQSGNFINNNTLLLTLGSLGGFVEPKPLRYGIAWGYRANRFSGGVRIVTDTLLNFDAGVMIRPDNWLSLGAVWQGVNHNWGRPGFGIGLRPVGPRITLFGETFINPLQSVIGLQIQPVRGMELSGRLRLAQTPDFTFGLNIGFGNTGLGITGINHPQQIATAVRFSSENRAAIFPESERYLEVKISEPILEQKPGLSLSGMSKARTGYALLSLIKSAARKDNIKGLLLKLENERFDFSFAGELRSAIIDFRLRNKKVIVYAQSLGMAGYYVASAADRIVLNPMGDLVIPGVALWTTFLKGALDKLDLKVVMHRRGRYKSAVEVFTEDSMSSDNREQLQSLVEGMYNNFLDVVSTGRNITRSELEGFIDRGFFRAEIAKQARLVDTLLYEDQLDSVVRIYLPGCRRLAEKQFLRGKIAGRQWGQLPQIAVVYILGEIVAGESGTDFLTGEFHTGAKTVCRTIKELAQNRQVRGIVLRVNSPGGDGVASELIWREMARVKNRKPVVVSMGQIAASGGYYVSCNADRIFAQPTTITGSIGVFSLRLVTEGLYNKLGIRRQLVKKGEHADALADYREPTPEEDSIFQDEIDWFYQHFVQRVAQGRNMKSEQVDSIAEGRIWLGWEAQQIGLVDSLGGLPEAIDCCRRLANLGPDYELVFYPQAGIGSLINRGVELLWDALAK
ncbi:MAG: signal peptide peptidase SppA [candidate division WOR-3 bacterium]